MWPSMRSTKTGSDVGGQRTTKGARLSLDFNRSFDDIDTDDEELRKERENLMQELLLGTVDGDRGQEFREERPVHGGESVDEELIEQMRAFVVDAERKREKAWVSTSSSTTVGTSDLTMSPSEMNDETSPFRMHGAEFGDEQGLSLRFDDDFTAFVSAPLGEENAIHSTGLEFGPTSEGLTAEQGFRYQSLGSVSDFGDDGDEAEGIPTESEMEDTRRWIFGRTGVMDREGRDLENVIGVLEEYKGEIAGMDDDEERRKAAARVALGVVYGLEGDRKELDSFGLSDMLS